MARKEIGDHVDAFLKRTLWIWLPFVALKILIKDFIDYRKSKQKND